MDQHGERQDNNKEGGPMKQSSHALKEFVELYLVSCGVEGRSTNTVRAYRETLGLFSPKSLE